MNNYHIENKDKHDSDLVIEEIKEFHKGNDVHFKLTLSDDSYMKIKKYTQEEINKLFKLTCTISTTNMVLFDKNNKIKKYTEVNEMIDEFYEKRLEYYEKRKEFLSNKLKYQLELNMNKVNFVGMILDNKINFKMSKFSIYSFLRENSIKIVLILDFLSNSQLKNKYKAAFRILTTDFSNETLKEMNFNENDYDYLMNMSIWNLTSEKIEEIENLISKNKIDLESLESKSCKDMWKEDIEEFLREYEVIFRLNRIIYTLQVIIFAKKKIK